MRLRLAACAVVLAPAVARAQPVTMSAPPAPTSATDGAASGAPAPAPAPEPFDPIDPDGWPRGVSLEALRGLPTCGPAGLPHTPGAPITCRPALIEHALPWALGFDWTTGITFGGVATEGGAHALGVELDFGLGRALALGARYELAGIAAPSGPGDRSGVSHQLFAMVRKRLWRDETARDAWTLGVGAGWAFRGDALGGSAPVARVSITREAGAFVDDTNAVTAALELAYEQSLGDAQLSAVLASVRLGFEIHAPPPLDLDRAPAPPPTRTASFGWMLGPGLGFDAMLGWPAGERWSLQTGGTFLFGTTNTTTEHGFDGASWSIETGPRYTFAVPEQVPLYAQLRGGAAWVARDPEREVRGFAEAELGLRLFVGCTMGAEAGLWARADVDRGFDLVDGGFVLRLVTGRGPGAPTSCAPAAPHLAEPPPPPPPAPEPPPTTIAEGGASASGEASGGASVTVSGGASASVDVHATVEPIVIDVDLGAVLAVVAVRVDPRLLPWDRLRGAGFVSVELSGPPDALATWQADLAAQLGRGGARVDAWASAPDPGAAVVHARFTIWPPGTRPPPP